MPAIGEVRLHFSSRRPGMRARDSSASCRRSSGPCIARLSASRSPRCSASCSPVFLTQSSSPPGWRTSSRPSSSFWRRSRASSTGSGASSSSSRRSGPACNWLHGRLGWFLSFSTPLLTLAYSPASIVLAMMVLPTVTAVSRDSIAAVDPRLREGSFGLGATRWETILAVTLPASKRGIYGARVVLGSRVGDRRDDGPGDARRQRNVISPSIFSPADTFAACSRTSSRRRCRPRPWRVMYAALVLLALTSLVNIAVELIVRVSSSGPAPIGTREEEGVLT